MRALTVNRLDSLDAGTFGILVDEEHRKLCCTLEPPWRNNADDVSCIPAGRYSAHRRMSDKRGYEVFELDDVPGRSHIEMHIGNLASDTEGCLLLGTTFGLLGDKRGILGSGEAFRAFMAAMAGVDAFTITVNDPPSLATTTSTAKAA